MFSDRSAANFHGAEPWNKEQWAYDEAGANFEHAKRLAEYHNARWRERLEQLRRYPVREHGISAGAAALGTIGVFIVDLPAMVASAQATRADGLAVLALAAAAAGLNIVLGWEIGTHARFQRDPQPPMPFQVASLAFFVALAVLWIGALYEIRLDVADHWSPGSSPVAIALFLSAFAAAAIAITGGLAFQIESPRVAEDRRKAAAHEDAFHAAQRARLVYAKDVQTSRPLKPKHDAVSAAAMPRPTPGQPASANTLGFPSNSSALPTGDCESAASSPSLQTEVTSFSARS